MKQEDLPHTIIRPYLIKLDNGMHYQVHAYTAADAITQVELHVRGSSPLPRVVYVAPWRETDGLRAHQLVWS